MCLCRQPCVCLSLNCCKVAGDTKLLSQYRKQRQLEDHKVSTLVILITTLGFIHECQNCRVFDLLSFFLHLQT